LITTDKNEIDMLKLDSHASGQHFLHIPGPSPVPPRVLRAISYQTIDHRGPEFGQLGLKLISGIQKIFKTTQPVIIFPSSGTGAWEGAMVNTLSSGDLVLMYETGHFATLWKKLADRLGIKTEFISRPSGDNWRYGIDPHLIEERLLKDTNHQIKAVCVVHNETSTGVTSDIQAVRHAIDNAKHPALLIVDTISGLASIDYEHEKWGVDVSISGSQKGLMMPPGLGFNAISPKALEANKKSNLIKAFWAWDEILESNKNGYWPTTPSTNLMYGLHETMEMIMTEGLDNVFKRHDRLAKACRAAVAAWGLELQCQDSSVYSPVLTGVVMPQGVNADDVRKVALERYNLSLGTGLGKIKGHMFRIGHLGDCNELALLGALSGTEMALKATGIKLAGSGVVAAQEILQ
jgi:alanine-glyoxylate transaminase/serine-glyoxylate transaminase/serine-pyruvate transaminase